MAGACPPGRAPATRSSRRRTSAASGRGAPHTRYTNAGDTNAGDANAGDTNVGDTNAGDAEPRVPPRRHHFLAPPARTPGMPLTRALDRARHPWRPLGVARSRAPASGSSLRTALRPVMRQDGFRPPKTAP
ncbi:pentapeptide repeat-containing protein [Streptomyces sp. NPDC047108]|uniref:pentapeptide repeat-containing protein n=1 Tax=Streptomyces sp. NPDC047108 TaxID=3155025 RepID=UPI00340F721E